MSDPTFWFGAVFGFVVCTILGIVGFLILICLVDPSEDLRDIELKRKERNMKLRKSIEMVLVAAVLLQLTGFATVRAQEWPDEFTPGVPVSIEGTFEFQMELVRTENVWKVPDPIHQDRWYGTMAEDECNENTVRLRLHEHSDLVCDNRGCHFGPRHEIQLQYLLPWRDEPQVYSFTATSRTDYRVITNYIMFHQSATGVMRLIFGSWLGEGEDTRPCTDCSLWEYSIEPTKTLQVHRPSDCREPH